MIVRSRSSGLIRWMVLLLLVIASGVGGLWGSAWWKQSQLREYENQCRTAKDRGDWNTLAVVSEKWAVWEPDSGQAWVMRALAAQESGDLPASAEFLEQIPDHYEGAIAARLELSTLYFEPLNRPVDGVRICERILDTNPKIVAAHQRLCHYFAMTLQRGRLLRQVRESIHRKAETVDGYNYLVTLPDLIFSDSLQRVTRWLEVTPDEPTLLVASALIRARDDKQKSGNEYEALMTQELRTILLRFPDDIELRTTLLEIVSRNGDIAGVEQLLESAPQFAGEDYRMWRIRSWFSLANGDSEAAEKAAREAIRLNPMDWHNWQHLAGILRQANQPAEAANAQRIAMFGKELQAVLLGLLDPRNPPRAALEGILEFAETCDDDLVMENLSRRLHVSTKKSLEFYRNSR